MTDNNGVDIRGVDKLYGSTVALKNINLHIPKGAFTVLLGPSGSGKTTLLSILGGFTEPTAGQVLIDGTDVTYMTPAQRPTTTMFQDYALFPHMTVANNVAFGLKMRKVPSAERSRMVNDILEVVGLGEMANRRIHQLSGGQKQRVALARSLIVNPSVLLLDEPLGALDLNLRRQMQTELTDIQKRIGTTFVHVTHDQDEAMSIADVIVVLDHGVIQDIGSPQEVYLRPKTRFTATFMGDSNLIDGVVRSKSADGLDVETVLGMLCVNGDANTGENVTLAVRPEQISIDAKNSAANAVKLGSVIIEDMVFVGTRYDCIAKHQSAGTEFIITLPQNTSYRRGEDVMLSAEKNDIVVLTN